MLKLSRNLLIFCLTAHAMTEVFNQLKSEGHNITRDLMAAFSPYHTEHLGRLGSFELLVD